MLRVLSTILAIAVVVLGAFAWQLRGETVSLREQIAVLTGERDAARKTEALVQKEIEPLKENNARLMAERDAAKKQVASVEAAPAAVSPAVAAPKAEAAGGGGMKEMAKMFQTEDGKKMLKSQMGMVTKMQYGDLGRTLKLSPQDSEQVMAMLTDRQAAMAGDPWGMLADGELDEAKLKEMGDKSAATKKEYDEKLKAILGEEKFKELETYEKTLGERVMLTQYDQTFNSAGVPLKAQQKDQLLQLMGDQRAKSPPSVFDQSGVDQGRNFKAMEDPEAIDKWIKQEEDYHQRVLNEAPKVLNPDQVVAFKQAMQQSFEMQKFGMKMGQQMLKKKGDAPIAPPTVVAPQK